MYFCDLCQHQSAIFEGKYADIRFKATNIIFNSNSQQLSSEELPYFLVRPMSNLLIVRLFLNSETFLSPVWRLTPSQSFSTPPASSSCQVEPVTTRCPWASSSARGTSTGCSCSVIWTTARWRSPWKTARSGCTSTSRQQ